MLKRRKTKLLVRQGASQYFEYTPDLSILKAYDPLKAQGLQTPGYNLFFVARSSKVATENRIIKSSPDAGIVIVSPTEARLYFAPTDTSAIAIPDTQDSLELYYGFYISNISTGVRFQIESMGEMAIQRAIY